MTTITDKVTDEFTRMLPMFFMSDKGLYQTLMIVIFPIIISYVIKRIKDRMKTDMKYISIGTDNYGMRYGYFCVIQGLILYFKQKDFVFPSLALTLIICNFCDDYDCYHIRTPKYAPSINETIKFSFEGNDLWCYDEIKEEQFGSQKRKIHTLTVYSKNMDTVTTFIQHCLKLDAEERKRTKNSYVEYNYVDKKWESKNIAVKKTFDNTFYNTTTIKQIKKNISVYKDILNIKDKLGIPAKRSMVLYGPPGTGKTSIAYVLSYELKMPIYRIGFDNLKDQFRLISGKAIILLDDFDTFNFTQTRDEDKKAKDEDKKKDEDEDKEIIFGNSFATFLNILDGYSGLEESIIIATTNHIDKIDPAILRSGRMDDRIYVGYCSREQIITMLTSTYGDDVKKEDVSMIPDGIIPPSTIICKIIPQNINSYTDTIKELISFGQK